MKTLRLTAAESRAYAAGERCFWRAMKPAVPATSIYGWVNLFGQHIFYPIDNEGFDWPDGEDGLRTCPYGTPGDRSILAQPNTFSVICTITAITVTQRDGKWGWLVEVGA